MLHVLFILLKILGILLLLLIGLILLVLLTPIRYSFKLEKEEQTSPEFTVRITWLFWIFYFKTGYIDKVFDYRVRILGHQVVGNQKDFLEKQKDKADRKKQKERKREERRKQKDSQGKNSHKKEEVSDGQSVAAAEKELSVNKKAQEDILGEERSYEYQEETKVQKQEEEEANPSKESLESLNKPDTREKEIKKSDSGKKKQKQQKKQENRQDNKKKNDSVFKNMKNRINSIKETKSEIDKLPWREWLELGKDIFIRFLKHVLPRKLEGTVAFGLDDPADTGYITAIAAIFYSRYGEHFSLYPDFERKMFSAHCKGKGRIRPGYMLVLVVSILKEKSVRTMIKNIILG